MVFQDVYSKHSLQVTKTKKVWINLVQSFTKKKFVSLLGNFRLVVLKENYNETKSIYINKFPISLDLNVLSIFSSKKLIYIA